MSRTERVSVGLEHRQLVSDLLGKVAKLDPRQAHQFLDSQHLHCFLHLFSAAPIAAFGWRPLQWFYFGCTLGSPSGGITELSPVFGVGAFIPESISGGQMTPALV
jgi:hypothetical protein